MKFNTSLKWRKGFALSATFLCCLLIAVACKKKNNPIGQDIIDQSELLASDGIDTFTLQTFSYLPDSVISSKAIFGLLGSYEDPVFGSYTSEIFTQFRLTDLNHDFGDISKIEVDSLVIALEYGSFYGSSGVQTIEVHEIMEDLYADSTYYSSESVTVNPNFGTNNGDLVRPGYSNLDMDVNNITVVDGDTLPGNQLRIHLHTSFAKQILIDAASGNGYFTDNESFLDYFKGLRIRTNNGMQSPGEGGIFYFKMTDPDSKMTLYYRENGTPKQYDFLINSSCAYFNHVTINNTATITSTFENEVMGATSFYAQAYGSRAVVKIPGLSNIPENSVIHKAVLELPVEYHYSSPYTPGFDATVSTILKEGETQLYGVSTASYSDYTKSFKSDIRSYVQAVVNGDLENTRLVISPALFNSTADRIIFNGAQSGNKNQPKLYILYTTF